MRGKDGKIRTVLMYLDLGQSSHLDFSLQTYVMTFYVFTTFDERNKELTPVFTMCSSILRSDTYLKQYSRMNSILTGNCKRSFFLNFNRYPHPHNSHMKLQFLFPVMVALANQTSAFSAKATPTSSLMKEYIPMAQKAMEYFDSSPDPFHAVKTSADLLQAAGFEELDTMKPYKNQLKQGGKYFFTKNKSTIVAFSIGNKYAAGNGFKIVGGHTDSPNLKVKPRSKRGGNGCIQLAVECYGGGLWHTWFDRDLGLSGRCFVRAQDGSIEQKLVKIDRAVLRIPNLAIHLNTAKEREAFDFNKEDQLVPILSLAVKNTLENGETKDKSIVSGEVTSRKEDGWSEFQEPILLKMLSSELNVNVEDILDFELNLYDVQKASLGGAYSEFVHSARLDNLASCFMAIQGLIDYSSEEELESDEDISLVALFDHEEVGSESATGAGSPIMGEAVERICQAFSNEHKEDSYSRSISKSFVLSVDQAHAIHPNYAGKHEKGHAPRMNDGMVIKRNSNQRYATNAVTGLIVREVAKKAGLKPIQEFVVRNDCGCGSTIGPIISSSTGIRAIDMGCPQLSMHSIRETMGTADFTHGIDLFKGFFKYFREVDDSMRDKN